MFTQSDDRFHIVGERISPKVYMSKPHSGVLWERPTSLDIHVNPVRLTNDCSRSISVIIRTPKVSVCPSLRKLRLFALSATGFRLLTPILCSFAKRTHEFISVVMLVPGVCTAASNRYLANTKCYLKVWDLTCYLPSFPTSTLLERYR